MSSWEISLDIELERLVGRFEQCWADGGRLLAEAVLPELEDPERRHRWLIELLHVEIELRSARGEKVDESELWARHPELGEEAIAKLVGEARAPAAVETFQQKGPRLIGPFQIESELGRGAFGIVYRAVDTRLGRQVALKVPRHFGLDDEGARDRFLREARNAARLRHRGLVALLEVGEIEGQIYLAYDLIEGPTLQALVGKGACPPRAVARWIQEIAEALEHAHGRGVLHRDVKPSNILLDEDQHAYLTDFGLGKQTEQEALGSGSTAQVGTPRYMAPEQARGQPASGQSDVYSLGAVMYEALTGVPVVQGQGRMVLLQLLEEEPRPPRRLNDGVPRDLENICLKCLEKEPGRRYERAGDLAADLRRYLAGEPIVARGLGPIDRLGRTARRRPVSTLAGLAVAVGLVGTYAGFAWHVRRVSRERSAFKALYTGTESTLRQLLETDRVRPKSEGQQEAARRRRLEIVRDHYRSFLQTRTGHIDPETVQAWMNLGEAEQGLGQPIQAVQSLQEALRRAEALGLKADDPRAEQLFCQALRQLVSGTSARVLSSTNRLMYAHRLVEISRRNSLSGRISNHDLAIDLLSLGNLQRSTGQIDEAARTYRLVLETVGSNLNASDQNFLDQLAHEQFLVAQALRGLGKEQEALKSYIEALRLYEELSPLHAGRADLRYQIAECQHYAARLLREDGRASEALPLAEASLETWISLQDLPPSDVVGDLLAPLAHAHNLMGSIRSDLGHHSRAIDQYALASARYRQLLQLEPDSLPFRRGLANTLHSQGNLLAELGQWTRALDQYGQALEARKILTATAEASAADWEDLGSTHARIGEAHESLHELDQAALCYERALAAVDGSLDRDPSRSSALRHRSEWRKQRDGIRGSRR